MTVFLIRMIKKCLNHPNFIGGFLGLDLPERKKILYSNSMKFQSARSALIFLLMKEKPKRLFLPDFICDELILACIQFGIKTSFYRLNEEFLPNQLDNVDKKDLILYINYFGICNENVKSLLSKFDPQQIIIDNSQAFFERPLKRVFATIYSPRKFFGLPDGGILYSKIFYKTPDKKDNSSIFRVNHLLSRLDKNLTGGLNFFHQSEQSLSLNIEPKEMSDLTLKIYNSIDFEIAKKIRSLNFYYLHKNLSESNFLLIENVKSLSPLCYPYMIDKVKATKLRKKLIKNSIFIPTYWKTEINYPKSQIAQTLAECILPIPIDQRLNNSDMNFILSILND
jgi:hypothetical protein